MVNFPLIFFIAGAVAAAVRGRGGDEHVRQGQDQRQPPPPPRQRQVLRQQALRENGIYLSTLVRKIQLQVKKKQN